MLSWDLDHLTSRCLYSESVLKIAQFQSCSSPLCHQYDAGFGSTLLKIKVSKGSFHSDAIETPFLVSQRTFQ